MRRLPLLLAAFASLLAGLGVAAYLIDAGGRDRLAPGLEVAGVDVGDMEVDEARSRLDRHLSDLRSEPVRVSHRGRSFELGPRALRVRLDSERMIDEALAAGRRGGFIERVVRRLRDERVEATIPLRLTYSRRALREALHDIEHAVERPPRDARVVASPRGLRRVGSRRGTALETRQLERAADRALRRPGAARSIAARTRPVEPDVTLANLAERNPAYLVVDRKRFRLRFYKQLRLARTYTVAIGRVGFDTPAGLYRIESKAVDPVWYVPDKPWAGRLRGKRIPPGPRNPIKSRWMGFHDGAGIHGTDDEASLGSAASYGCVRMRIPEVKRLYDQVPVGTPLYIG